MKSSVAIVSVLALASVPLWLRDPYLMNALITTGIFIIGAMSLNLLLGFTGQLSLDLATECARMIGCRYDTIPISPAVTAFDEMLAGSFADKDVDITEENVQSRIRGVTLMALSNKFGPMLLTTGNKSEMSVGYATIYGDMAGGYNPLKDAYKMTVFAISKWRNASSTSTVTVSRLPAITAIISSRTAGVIPTHSTPAAAHRLRTIWRRSR